MLHTQDCQMLKQQAVHSPKLSALTAHRSISSHNTQFTAHHSTSYNNTQFTAHHSTSYNNTQFTAHHNTTHNLHELSCQNLKTDTFLKLLQSTL
jgi:hypothetical protein